jgi:hypothetical protein
MTHKLIHTPNYLLVVDDSEIKEGNKSLLNVEGFEPMILTHHEPIEEGYEGKKIIAHLPLNNSPILEGVDLLPPFEQEDDVDELAKEYGESIGNKDGTSAFDYKRGYNKAKEKYKYTEEDIRMAVRDGSVMGEVDDEEYEEYVKWIIQSLSQPKMPVVFECEEKVSSDSMYVNHVIYETKTITTSKGNTQWVGKYIHQ